MIRDVHEWMALLRREGELVEIEAEVDPNLELAEIHRRVIAANGPALLFKRPKGYEIPVVTNLLGTKRRVDLCFGPRPRQFVERAVRMVHELVPPTFGKLWDNRDFFMDAPRIGTRRVSAGPVTQTVTRGGGLNPTRAFAPPPRRISSAAVSMDSSPVAVGGRFAVKHCFCHLRSGKTRFMFNTLATFDRASLHALPHTAVRAHGGVGHIQFCRVVETGGLAGGVNFIDHAVLAPGVSIGRHRHGEGEEELYLVLAGEGVMWRDGEEFVVRAGDLIRNAPGGTHGLHNPGPAPLEIFVFELRVGGP